MKRVPPLLIPLVLLTLLLFSCHQGRRAIDLQSRSVIPEPDPYVGAWDFVVQNVPSGNAEGIIEIQRTGKQYRAELASGMGDLVIEELAIQDERLSGHFRYKGFRVNVKGVFEGNTLEGKLAVTLASFPLRTTKRL